MEGNQGDGGRLIFDIVLEAEGEKGSAAPQESLNVTGRGANR